MFFYIDFYSQYEHINLTLIQHKQQQQQKSDEGVFLLFFLVVFPMLTLLLDSKRNDK